MTNFPGSDENGELKPEWESFDSGLGENGLGDADKRQAEEQTTDGLGNTTSDKLNDAGINSGAGSGPDSGDGSDSRRGHNAEADSKAGASNMGSWRTLLEGILGKEAAQQALAALENAGVEFAQWSNITGMPTDPLALQMYLSQMQMMLNNPEKTTVNWDFAAKAAAAAISSEGDPVVSALQGEKVRNALMAADLWIDAVTDFNPAVGPREVWNRQTWLTRTLPTWREMVEPVAERTCAQMMKIVAERMEDVPDDMAAYARAMAGPTGVASKMVGAVYAQQMGQALVKIAGESCGSTDAGFPLLNGVITALLPANVEEFAQGLDVPADEVLALWALREAAHARLYANVPWLRAKVLNLVADYAAAVEIDVQQLSDMAERIDAHDPEEIGKLLDGGLYVDMNSPAQKMVCEAIETLLALVEGWVETVTLAAGAPHLPHIVALSEMVRRRRATGGPAEQAFAALVGMELRPRRMREAARLWAMVQNAQGVSGRDKWWSHPDVLPTSADLDNPHAFLARTSLEEDEEASFAQELQALLDGSLGPAPREDEPNSDGSEGEGGSSE